MTRPPTEPSGELPPVEPLPEVEPGELLPADESKAVQPAAISITDDRVTFGEVKIPSLGNSTPTSSRKLREREMRKNRDRLSRVPTTELSSKE